MVIRLGRLYRRWLRRQKSTDSHWIPSLVIAMLLLGVALLAYQLLFVEPFVNHMIAQNLLSLGMPSVSGELLGYPGWRYTLRSMIYMVTDYDLGNPQSFFESTVPVLASLQARSAYEKRSFVFLPELSYAPEPLGPDKIQSAVDDPRATRQTNNEAPFITQTPRVLLYHTHSSEMYLGPAASQQNYRNAHFVFKSAADDKVTGVMEVGRHFSNALQRFGIGVIHDTRIHDWPSLARSYLNSERTVRELLNRYPSVEFIFDLHRDAGVPDPVVVIGGQRVARILLVLGTAQDIPQDHPHWRSNMEFAQEIWRMAERMYPGLMRPTQVRRDARYNQHLHPKSVILEMGSVENTLDEALLAAELLANVIHQIVKASY